MTRQKHFYYAGFLTCADFDAATVSRNAHTSATEAANSALAAEMKHNYVGAPQMVNFGIAIELYLKLLRLLADGFLEIGHSLYRLFLKLEKASRWSVHR
jgi:hypothetical protein